jgi:flavodoxin
VKVFVVYDSKHGNTKLVAEKILEGIRGVTDFETSIGYVGEVEPGKLVEYDALVLGAPNHMGRPSGTMKKFVSWLSDYGLKAKKVAVFGTYAGKERTEDRAVKKLQRMVEEKLPTLGLISPGLSIRVNGIKGPLVDGELPKCVDFGRKIGLQLVSNQ